MDPNEPQSTAALAKNMCKSSCMSFVSKVSESPAPLCNGASQVYTLYRPSQSAEKSGAPICAIKC